MKLPGQAAGSKRYELHEGEIYVTACPRPRHQMVVRNLHLIIAEHVRRLGFGEVFLSPIDVILSEVTVVEPDLISLDARVIETSPGRQDVRARTAAGRDRACGASAFPRPPARPRGRLALSGPPPAELD
jgi:hypothetical protein